MAGEREDAEPKMYDWNSRRQTQKEVGSSEVQATFFGTRVWRGAGTGCGLEIGANQKRGVERWRGLPRHGDIT